MSIQDSIRDANRDAMREKNEVKKNAIRSVLSGFTTMLVARGRKPTDSVSDEDALAVIKGEVKKRKDSIIQFRKGGREELAGNEEDELVYLLPLLPAEPTEDEVRAIVIQKRTELGEQEKNIGILIGAVMKEFGGNADGNTVRKIASEG